MVFRLLSGREAWQLLAQLFAQCRLIAESYIIRVRGVGSTASILPRTPAGGLVFLDPDRAENVHDVAGSVRQLTDNW